jgi:hypothetical protein
VLFDGPPRRYLGDRALESLLGAVHAVQVGLAGPTH